MERAEAEGLDGREDRRYLRIICSDSSAKIHCTNVSTVDISAKRSEIRKEKDEHVSYCPVHPNNQLFYVCANCETFIRGPDSAFGRHYKNCITKPRLKLSELSKRVIEEDATNNQTRRTTKLISSLKNNVKLFTRSTFSQFLQEVDKDDESRTIILGTENNIFFENLTTSKVSRINKPQQRKQHYAELLLLLHHVIGITAHEELPSDLESVTNHDLVYFCRERGLPISGTGIEMREALGKFQAKSPTSRLQKMEKERYIDELFSVYPLRQYLQSMLLEARLASRAEAGQEALDLAGATMQKEFGMLLFACATSGRDMDRIKHVLGCEPKSSSSGGKKNTTRRWAVKYYNDTALTEYCKHTGDALGGWPKLKRTSSQFELGTAVSLAGALATWCAENGRPDAAKQFQSAPNRSTLAKDLYRYTVKMPFDIGVERQRKKRLLLQCGTELTFGGWHKSQYDSELARAKCFGMYEVVDDPAIVRDDADTLKIMQKDTATLSIGQFISGNHFFTGNLATEIPSSLNEVKFRLFDVRWKFAQKMYALQRRGIPFNLLPPGIYELQYRYWGDGSPINARNRTDLQYSLLENLHVTTQMGIHADVPRMHRFMKPLKVCHAWSKECVDVFEICGRLATEHAMELSQWKFSFDSLPRTFFKFKLTIVCEDFKATQHDMGVSIGGDQRYPFRDVLMSDQRLQHWEEGITLPIRTISKAWEDLYTSPEERETQTPPQSWVRPPTLIAPFISKRRRVNIPKEFYPRLKEFTLGNALKHLSTAEHPMLELMAGRAQYQSKQIAEEDIAFELVGNELFIKGKIQQELETFHPLLCLRKYRATPEVVIKRDSIPYPYATEKEDLLVLGKGKEKAETPPQVPPSTEVLVTQCDISQSPQNVVSETATKDASEEGGSRDRIATEYHFLCDELGFRCCSESLCSHVTALGMYLLYNTEGLSIQYIDLEEVQYCPEMSHTLKGMYTKIRTLFKSETKFDDGGWKENKLREFRKPDGSLERHRDLRIESLTPEKMWYEGGDPTKALLIKQSQANARWILELQKYAVVLGFTKERSLGVKDIFRQIVVSALCYGAMLVRWGTEPICCYTVGLAFDCVHRIRFGPLINSEQNEASFHTTKTDSTFSNNQEANVDRMETVREDTRERMKTVYFPEERDYSESRVKAIMDKVQWKNLSTHSMGLFESPYFQRLWDGLLWYIKSLAVQFPQFENWVIEDKANNGHYILLLGSPSSGLLLPGTKICLDQSVPIAPASPILWCASCQAVRGAKKCVKQLCKGCCVCCGFTQEKSTGTRCSYHIAQLKRTLKAQEEKAEQLKNSIVAGVAKRTAKKKVEQQRLAKAKKFLDLEKEKKKKAKEAAKRKKAREKAAKKKKEQEKAAKKRKAANSLKGKKPAKKKSRTERSGKRKTTPTKEPSQRRSRRKRKK